ncbi:MAG: endonuclease domain-containing protein [Sphingopyxis sp.]|uniref:endonuclease domain-containing protein n=1 Tax=Sphingopyxis sp. TaxID=1908224 RepID=UPI001A5D71A0|nr:endonuclease domain-containing protein [Sphingopyxis sp.]MBL9067532.1 endonuclease domain-containing protein [Sphingopyxis sp.]
MAVQNPPRNGEGDRAKRGGGGSRGLQHPQVYTARRLRRAMTLPEVLLWEQLRAQRLGVKFRRQHPVGPYVTDFCSMAIKLVVEIDGEAHDRGAAPARDAARDAFLAAQGFEVVRVTAKDVLENMDGVLQFLRIKSSPVRGGGAREARDGGGSRPKASLEAAAPLHHAFGAVPLPASGEDF